MHNLFCALTMLVGDRKCYPSSKLKTRCSNPKKLSSGNRVSEPHKWNSNVCTMYSASCVEDNRTITWTFRRKVAARGFSATAELLLLLVLRETLISVSVRSSLLVDWELNEADVGVCRDDAAAALVVDADDVSGCEMSDSGRVTGPPYDVIFCLCRITIDVEMCAPAWRDDAFVTTSVSPVFARCHHHCLSHNVVEVCFHCVLVRQLFARNRNNNRNTVIVLFKLNKCDKRRHRRQKYDQSNKTVQKNQSQKSVWTKYKIF